MYQSNFKDSLAQYYFNKKANRWLGIVSIAFVGGYMFAHLLGYVIYF